MLSFAGRATLIRAVAGSIPAYSMASVLLPTNLCSKLHQSMRMFWWGHSKASNLCLKSWKNLCLPKAMGGLGFRKMGDMNRALVAKLAWQVAAKEDRIWANQLRAKYCRKHDFFHVEKAGSDSALWKSILGCRDLIRKGACYAIGDGRSVCIWSDPWVPFTDSFRVKPKEGAEDLPLMVWELINQTQLCWDIQKLKECFNEEDVAAICMIDIPETPEKDKLIWVHSRDGKFSVKSAYKTDQRDRLSQVNNEFSHLFSRIWKAKIHERAKMFLWRCVAKVIPTRDRIANRVHTRDVECLICGQEVENEEHLFMRCRFAKGLWWQCWGLRSVNSQFNSVEGMIEETLEGRVRLGELDSERILIVLAITMEEIWRVRNLFWKGESIPPMNRVVIQVKTKVSEFWEAMKGRDINVKSSRIEAREHLQERDCRILFDAAVRKEFAVAAACIINERGDQIRLVTEKLLGVDPEIAEAKAAKLGIKKAVELGFKNLDIAGDALNVINMIKSSQVVPWRLKATMSDVGILLGKCEFWKAQKIGRKENEAPHLLAAWAARNNVFGMLPENQIPSCIMQVLGCCGL